MRHMVFTLFLCSPLAMAESEPLQWFVTPYLWAMDTQLDLRAGDVDLGGGELAFRDALDVLDASFMLSVEAGRGHWSGFGDIMYVRIEDTQQRPLVAIDSSNKMTFADLGVAYWPAGVGSGLSILAGARYSEFDNRYRFTTDDALLRDRRDRSDYLDALLGVRYVFELGERWSLIAKGDVSFGDSEGTWQARALLARTVGSRRQNRILFGYQYRDAEFAANALSSAYVFHGPVAGFTFSF